MLFSKEKSSIWARDYPDMKERILYQSVAAYDKCDTHTQESRLVLTKISETKERLLKSFSGAAALLHSNSMTLIRERHPWLKIKWKIDSSVAV